MKNNVRYDNLLRATHLARLSKEPYVPYDEPEIRSLTKKTVLKNLPEFNGTPPKGWRVYSVFSSDDYQGFSDALKTCVNTPDGKEFGAMVGLDGKGFFVFLKASF